MSNHYLRRVTSCRDCPYLYVRPSGDPGFECRGDNLEPPTPAEVVAAVEGDKPPPEACVLRDLPLLVIGTFDGAGPS